MAVKDEGKAQFDCVVQNMRRASRLVSKRYEEAFRTLNLKSSQFTVLRALSGRGGVPHGKMAEVLGFDQTTFSRVVKPLQKRGLLKVLAAPDDRRQRLISLTPEGEALFQEAKLRWSEQQEKTLSRVSSEEWDMVKDVLGRLSA